MARQVVTQFMIGLNDGILHVKIGFVRCVAVSLYADDMLLRLPEDKRLDPFTQFGSSHRRIVARKTVSPVEHYPQHVTFLDVHVLLLLGLRHGR